ncbi:MAG: hypothetical protein F2839_01805 [Actinobacteria bacterium]|uniref:Unannotated protein n=1 Tax=freshwater metagenome TaxID=449393 RepID=A0A6J5YY52_9ZZZZ|nr:hypothetical protein [Actinomycetota bacterium]
MRKGWKDHRVSDSGYAVVELAVVLPIMAFVGYLIAWAATLVVQHLHLIGLAQSTVRIIARGDVIPDSLQKEISKSGQMSVTQNGEILRVTISAQKSPPMGLPVGTIKISESAVALVELTANDFEQD